MKHTLSRLLKVTVLMTVVLCSGCAVIAVADAVVVVAATVVVTTVKVAGAVVNVVIPD